MADIEEEETPLIIRFVLPRNKSETTCTEDLSYAFDQAQDHDMNPTWIKDETCTSLTPAKTVSRTPLKLLIYVSRNLSLSLQRPKFYHKMTFFCYRMYSLLIHLKAKDLNT